MERFFLLKLRFRNNRRLLAAAFQPVERESRSHGKSESVRAHEQGRGESSHEGLMTV